MTRYQQGKRNKDIERKQQISIIMQTGPKLTCVAFPSLDCSINRKQYDIIVSWKEGVILDERDEGDISTASNEKRKRYQI